MKGNSITAHPVHLGLLASAVAEPLFTGAMAWYEDYAQRHLSDGIEGRLVSMHTFDQPWDSWEMHPGGSELVLCTAGSITLFQQQPDGSANTVVLTAGQYAINPPGVWHTADVQESATVLFITAGMGTQQRARSQ
jgi:quercetin dioxygenase-like cupin family protein